MSAFPITFIVSACLLAIFIIYFARTHSGQRKRGVDQESLLPLEEETPRVVGSSPSAGVKHNAADKAVHSATDKAVRNAATTQPTVSESSSAARVPQDGAAGRRSRNAAEDSP